MASTSVPVPVQCTVESSLASYTYYSIYVCTRPSLYPTTPIYISLCNPLFQISNLDLVVAYVSISISISQSYHISFVFIRNSSQNFSYISTYQQCAVRIAYP